MVQIIAGAVAIVFTLMLICLPNWIEPKVEIVHPVIESRINWFDVDAADWQAIDFDAMMTDEEWDIQWEREKFAEAEIEFDRIFAAVEFKVAKNGRSMVKGNFDKSFKFVKMA